MSFLKKTFIISLVALGILGPVLVFAAPAGDAYGLSTAADQAGLADLAISKKSIPQFAGEVIGVGLSLIGIVFFLLMLYAGLRWMIAMGKSEDVQKAKDTLEAAAIGLVIVLAAYAITQFVFTNLGVGSGGGNTSPVGEMGPPAPSTIAECSTADDCEFGDDCVDGSCMSSENIIFCLTADDQCIRGTSGTGCGREFATESACMAKQVVWCLINVQACRNNITREACGQENGVAYDDEVICDSALCTKQMAIEPDVNCNN